MTSEAGFEAAIDCARSELQSLFDAVEWQAPPEIQRLRIVESALDLLKENPQRLYSLAKVKPLWFEATRLAIAFRLKQQEPLSEVERDWLIDFLAEITAPPKRKRGRPDTSENAYIYGIAIETLISEHGMRPTRNDESPPYSACDAVATAMKSLGRKPNSYERIKANWLEFRRQFPEG